MINKATIRYNFFKLLIEFHDFFICAHINCKTTYVLSLPEANKDFYILKLSIAKKTILNFKAYKNSMWGKSNVQVDLNISKDYLRPLLMTLYVRRIQENDILLRLSNKISFENDGRIVLDYGTYTYRLPMAIDDLYTTALLSDFQRVINNQ